MIVPSSHVIVNLAHPPQESVAEFEWRSILGCCVSRSPVSWLKTTARDLVSTLSFTGHEAHCDKDTVKLVVA